jgi:hypothetical protein
MQAGAIMSEDAIYRYALWRTWGDGKRRLVVIGLNPSTADAVDDDPTIRRCIGFAKREQCDGLFMLNLFAFRATEPRDMLRANDPIGPDNDEYIRQCAVGKHNVVVAAWGALGGTRGRDRHVARLLGDLYCLGRTKAGQPRHPLYLPAEAPLELWSRAGTQNGAQLPSGATR